MNRNLLKAITVSPLVALGIGLIAIWLLGFFGMSTRLLTEIKNEASTYYGIMIVVFPSVFAFWLLGADSLIPRLSWWSKVAAVPLILAHVIGIFQWMFEGGRCWKYRCGLAEFMVEPLWGVGFLFFSSIAWYLLTLTFVSIFAVVRIKLLLFDLD